MDADARTQFGRLRPGVPWSEHGCAEHRSVQQHMRSNHDVTD